MKRESNIELLRLILMLFIMIEHLNFYSQKPYMICYMDSISASEIGAPLFIKFFLLAITSCAVPCFILISGWFGINFKIKGILKIYLQCLFCETVSYFLFSIIGGHNICSNEIIGLLYFKNCNYWFLKGYLLLYIISPTINIIIGRLKKQYLNIISLMMIFPLIYFLFQGKQGGLVLFCILYFIGRCLHENLSGKGVLKKRLFWMGGYVVITLLLFSSAMFCLCNQNINMPFRIFSDFNPVIISSSICLLLYFISTNIRYNRNINFLAGSVFSAYILQENAYFGYQWLYPTLSTILNNISFTYSLILLLLFAILTLICGIIVDKVCKMAYIHILNLYDYLFKKATIEV